MQRGLAWTRRVPQPGWVCKGVLGRLAPVPSAPGLCVSQSCESAEPR